MKRRRVQTPFESEGHAERERARARGQQENFEAALTQQLRDERMREMQDNPLGDMARSVLFPAKFYRTDNAHPFGDSSHVITTKFGDNYYDFKLERLVHATTGVPHPHQGYVMLRNRGRDPGDARHIFSPPPDAPDAPPTTGEFIQIPRDEHGNVRSPPLPGAFWFGNPWHHADVSDEIWNPQPIFEN